MLGRAWRHGGCDYISHDQAHARCSPGQLLMLHALRQAAAAGLQGYEFMGVMDEWTTR
jgi:CelD/BcsL family acetyltransferase involved in cellulose biosynthesis